MQTDSKLPGASPGSAPLGGSAKRTEKPIEYYVNRNAIFECVAVVGWWFVVFLILAMILARL